MAEYPKPAGEPASGAIFDAMKQWNPAKLPGVAAAVLRVANIYSGGEQIV